MRSPLRSPASRFSSVALSSLSSLSSLLLVGALVASSQTVHAQVLFNDFGVGDSYSSGSGITLYSERPGVRQAFQFTPTASGVVGSVETVLERNAGSPTVNFQILSSNGTTPGFTTLFSGTGTITTTPGIYTFSSASGSAITAGVQYYALVLPADDGDALWYQNNTGATGNRALSINNGAYASQGTSTLPVFRINAAPSAVGPEPSTLPLVGMGLTAGLATVGTMKRRKAKKQKQAI